MMSETEARIRRLSARLQNLEFRTSNVGDKIRRDRQALGSFRQPSWNPCTATISGKLIGGDAAAIPLAGSTIEVAGHTSGLSYGTFAVPSGLYSVDVSLVDTDTSVDIFITGPTPRFATGAAVTVPITNRCASNALADIQATPAPGFHFMTGANACQWPIKNTMSFTEPALYGSGVLHWDTVSHFWPSVCQQATSRATTGVGACASVTAAIYLAFIDSGDPSLSYLATIGTGCPAVAACGVIPGGTALGGTGTGFTGLAHTFTCPDATTLFSVTITATIPANHKWYAPGTFTITYFET